MPRPRSLKSIIDAAAGVIFAELVDVAGELPTKLSTVKQVATTLGLDLDPVGADDPRRGAIFEADPQFGADLILDARERGRIRWDATLPPSGQAILIWHECAEALARDRGQRSLFWEEERYTFSGRAWRQDVHHRTAIIVEDMLIRELQARGIDTQIMERCRREKREIILR